MKNLSYLLILLFGILFSCQENEEPQGEDEIFWFYKIIPCDNTSLKSCLIIQRGESFDYFFKNFDTIPNKINGFPIETSFIYQLKVLKTIDSQTGEFKRNFLEIIQQKRDGLFPLLGSWEIKKSGDIILPNENFPNGLFLAFSSFPRLVKVYNGCNYFTLKIGEVGSDQILSFGDLTLNLANCPSLINPLDGISSKFRKEGDRILFVNEDGFEVLVLKKII